MSWFYYFARLMVRVLLFFTRFELTGKENIPAEGALIVVANHLSLADPPILGTVVPRKMVFMAKQELFRSSISGYFVRSFGAFPVHREKPGIKAIREAEEVLNRGMALAIFPEGRRSQTGGLGEASPGVAFIARHSGAPILPVGISGTEKIRGIGWLFRRPHIRIRIGLPFNPVSDGQQPGKTAYKELTDEIMRHVAELLPAEYGGTDANKGY
ncbi:MAG: lysophospholipid acyltransferase family protein [Chloroflexota bacterium]